MIHEYTFVPGMRSTTVKKPVKTTINDAVWMLSTAPWAGVLRFDEFSKQVVAVGPPLKLEAETGRLSDEDLAAIGAWLNYKGKLAGADMVASAALLAARKNPFHPIRDYLANCQQAAPTGLLDTLATRVFGCDVGIANDFLRMTLIGAVRRIRQPGAKLDTMLVIVGKQGRLKSTFVAELFGPAFTRSQMPDISSKDASEALRGYWAVELAELDRVIRAETDTVKEFLSRTNDDYRRSYGRADKRYPRECVFIGTTNEQSFLRDPTGNRRFWPIAAEHVDLDFVRANRDAIWGEAAVREAAGEQYWLDAEGDAAADEVRAAHVTEDPWHERIADYLHGRQWLTNEDVYRNVIAGLTANYGRREQMRIGDTLRRLGCAPEKRNDRRGWLVPAVFASAPCAEPAVRVAVDAGQPRQPSASEVVQSRQLGFSAAGTT